MMCAAMCFLGEGEDIRREKIELGEHMYIFQCSG